MQPVHTPLAVLLVALLASAPLAHATMAWRPCDGEPTSFLVKQVVLTPDPPVIGGSATFTITAGGGPAVTGGTVDISVSLMGLPIYGETQDLCANAACPLAAGADVGVTIVELLPPIAPPAQYGLRVVAHDLAGEQLMCVDVDFELVPAPSCRLFGQMLLSPTTTWRALPAALRACLTAPRFKGF